MPCTCSCYIYIYVICDCIVARYGLVEGERVSVVMDGTLRAGKMYGYRYFYFVSNVINDSLADTRFFANSCLALNFGWVLGPRPHESLEMKVYSYCVYIKQCTYIYTDLSKALKRDSIYNLEKRVSGIYLHLF